MKKIIVFLLMLFPFFVNAKEIVQFSNCVDGDTFKVIIKNEIKSVRMLAVDTPETVHPNKEVGYYGKEASEYTCNTLKNASIIELEYDENSDKTDKYNRILAWVFVDDYLLQDSLIKGGYAEVAYLYGNYKYTDILKDHEEVAKANKLGIWGVENTTSVKEDNNEKTTESSEKDSNTSEEEKDNDSYLISILILLVVSFLAGLYKEYKKKLKKKLKKSKINLDI